MAQLTIVYWRDIPAQVIVKQGRQAAKRQLTERFEKAIDRAAMRAKLRDTDSYLAEWRRAEDRVTRERLWRKRGVRRAVGDGSTSRRGLWCWRLGDALLFGHPHEAYSVFQTELRRRFPGSPEFEALRRGNYD